MKNVIIAIFLTLAAMATCARGAELFVPNQYLTIQSAIDASVDGDIVIVAPGTYTGPGNRDINFLGKAITVRSIFPDDPCIVAATIIDCNGTETGPHRGFYFHNGEDANSILTGLKIINGYFGQGGGIYCQPSSPTISNCIITGNSANAGGGICCNLSSPTISNCNISHNVAVTHIGWGRGCGIYCYLSSPIISNCVVSYNLEGQGDSFGGGIYCELGNLKIVNSTISMNDVYAAGGGIECVRSTLTIAGSTVTDNRGSLGGGICLDRSGATITDCVIGRNISYSAGGGVYCGEGDLVITGSKISANSAVEGGGICCDSRNTSTITNCTISGNSADRGGGLMDCTGYITNCTITANLASFDGGGLYKCICLASNCIIWGNSPQQQIFDPYSTTSVIYSNIQGSWSGLGNIDADPCFIELGCWIDANDPNIIVEPNDLNAVWLDGDYHLLPTSLCINAGDPNYVPEPNETDLDGNPRVNNGRIDMGAYESIMHEARPWFWPQVINRKSRQPKMITAQVFLPAGITKDQVDKNTPLTLYPSGIEAVHQFVMQNCGRFDKQTRILAFFDREEFLDFFDTNGSVRLMILGRLLEPGQFFFGSDTIKIVAPKPPPYRHW